MKAKMMNKNALMDIKGNLLYIMCGSISKNILFGKKSYTLWILQHIIKLNLFYMKS